MRVAASLHQMCVNGARALVAPLRFFSHIMPTRHMPVVALTVVAASGAACAVGAARLTAATQDTQPVPPHAAFTAKAEAEGQPEASKDVGSNVHISTNNSTQVGGAAARTNVTSTVTSTTPNQAATNVTVNGQPITVPTSGTIDKTINDSGGTTTVRVESNASESATSSVHVEVNSTSTTTRGGQ